MALIGLLGGRGLIDCDACRAFLDMRDDAVRRFWHLVWYSLIWLSGADKLGFVVPVAALRDCRVRPWRRVFYASKRSRVGSVRLQADLAVALRFWGSCLVR